MKIVTTLILLVISRVLCAQTDAGTVSPFHAGLRLGYLENFHRTDAICPTCGTYSNGTGSGYAAEFFGEIPFNFFRRLDLTFGIGLVNRGGDFGEAVSNTLTVRDPNSGAYVPFVQQSSYHANLTYLDITTGVRLRPLAAFAAYFAPTIEAGIPLGRSANYEQVETILSPAGVYYPSTNATTQTDGSGVIPNIHTSFGLSGTLGYEIPISNMLTASPEISYFYPLNTVESGFFWRVSSVRAGVALRWNKAHAYKELPPAKPEPLPIVQREDPNALAPTLIVTSLAGQPFHIIETTVTETFPILPYIFFDSASSALSDRFAQLSAAETQRFLESELPHRSLESYYNILNIVGNRLRLHPGARLTINGTSDGREVRDLPPQHVMQSLARERAETVRDYLVHIWGIDSNRLDITTTDVPKNPSSSEYPEGLEENRRVELGSNDDQILKPIVHERFREESSSPKSTPIHLSASSKIGIRGWRLVIQSHGAVLFERSGQGTPPEAIEWSPTAGQVESLAKALEPQDSISCVFEASASNGAHSTKIIGLPASKSINPFELSRLSLIVFDFDQSAIDRQNRRMISLFVAKSFYPVSTASITGSTDNLGELRHNEKLSTDRAFNVRDLILVEKPDSKITSTRGIGPSNLLYDNHLPEGRYYCRTVRVEVETPLEAILKGQ